MRDKASPAQHHICSHVSAQIGFRGSSIGALNDHSDIMVMLWDSSTRGLQCVSVISSYLRLHVAPCHFDQIAGTAPWSGMYARVLSCVIIGGEMGA